MSQPLSPRDTVSAHKFRALVDHCKNLEKQLADALSKLHAHRLYSEKEVWFWQSEGDNYLRSISGLVVIDANDLRRIVPMELHNV